MAAPHLMIDCASLAYRAYHAVPSLRGPGETEINAVLGFLNFLSRLIADRKPRLLHVALDDDWRPAWRVEALPSYKSHRVAGPGDPVDPVDAQMKIIVEVLDAVGISTAAAPGFEAEDVIATLATTADGPVEVVTGDRDLFQLVADPKVTVLYTLRGVSDLARVDQEYVHQKYGIPGDRYMDYAILRGDPSDGLPGVAGIGEKTASELLRKYGSLDGILAAATLSPTIAVRLRRAADYIVAARRVVAMPRDCPVTGGDGTIPTEPRDAALVRALAQKYALTNSIDRLLAAMAAQRPSMTK